MNNITFEQFIKTYNFRYVNDIKINGGKDYDNDTCIIRIYPPTNEWRSHNTEWFEFGLYDFSEKEATWEFCKKIFKKEIINSYIDTIEYNTDYERVVTIYLTESKTMEY